MARTVSVIVPYYNGSQFVGSALASIRNQTRPADEIIIVDDGSRPDEAAVLDREAKDCLVIHLPRNLGPSAARNVGIARARGDWIAFLDCDDEWERTKLEKQLAVANSTPGCRAVHCGMRNVRIDGTEVVDEKSNITLDDFLIFPCAIFPSAVMMERQSLFEAGLFDPTMGVCHDLDLFLRFCYLGNTFYCVPEALLTRRVQPGSVSRNIANFWSDAARVYHDYMPVFPDTHRARKTLTEVYIDMTVRAIYARDFRLLRRMLRRARQRDAAVTNVLARAFSRVIRHRFARP